MIIADKEYQKLSKLIKHEIIGRYFYHCLEVDNIGMSVTYFVEDYKPAKSEIVMRRLFDPNGILLDHAPMSN